MKSIIPAETISTALPRINRLPTSDGRSNGSVALDQWRGFALLLVLVSHGLFFTDMVNGIGRIGVNLFFFISGILVFRSLNKKPTSGRELATSFWRRRLLRLYPALIAYLLLMVLVVYLFQDNANLPLHSDLSSYLRALPWAFGYSINYAPIDPASMGHLWSLACEMQFYLLAPVIFLLGGTTFRRRLVVYGTVLMAFMILGIALPLRVDRLTIIRYHFEVAAWPMMLGFVCEFAKRWFMAIPPKVARFIWWFGIVALMTSVALMPFGMHLKKVVVGSGAIVMASCLMSYLFGLSLDGVVGKFLAWVGERTYSIYLWQQPLTLCDFLPSSLHLAGAVVSIAVGAVSFRLFEKPFLSESRSLQLSPAKPSTVSPNTIQHDAAGCAIAMLRQGRD